jgi:hypothetical protein
MGERERSKYQKSKYIQREGQDKSRNEVTKE